MRSDQVIMLTALGVILKDASYGVPQLNGSKVVVSANMSPLALLKGLPEEELPDKVIALGTKEALEKSGVVLIKEAKLPVEFVQIPEGKSEEDLWEILRIMLSQVPRSSRLILELTHGFRSLPFIFFTGAFFLSSLYDVKIEHVFYGMFEAKENDVAPIVDLNIIIKMMEWFYASRVFRDTGRARYIVDLFKEKEFSEKDIRALESFSESYEAALPIELGKAAFEFRKRIGSLKQEEEFPVGPYIKEVLEEAVRPFEFRDKVKMKGKLKRNLSLTWDELMRQANIIDLYIERRQFNQAFGIMRELLVTIFLYHNPQFCEELWSTRRGRKKAEAYKGSNIPVASLFEKYPAKHTPKGGVISTLAKPTLTKFPSIRLPLLLF
jgi:CRISPR-associated Csx2 family protein